MELVSVLLKLFTTLFTIGMTIWSWRVVNWVWIRPKRLEKCLREQGLKGNSYRFLFGDLKESAKLVQEAKLKPISPLSDDIAPRVSPFHCQTIKNYGKDSFMWVGPAPSVNIMNPEHLKDIFTRFGDFYKIHSNALVRILAAGLALCEGEEWVKRRKILNPAFRMERLKDMLPTFHRCCCETLMEWESLLSYEGTCDLDVYPYLANMTSDVISRTAFGRSYEEGIRIFKLQKEQAKLAVEAAQNVYVPGWRFVPTRLNRRMKEIDNEIKLLFKDMIQNREKGMRAGERPDDLLGMLIESNRKEIEENKNVGLSIEDVVEDCKLFYFAGQVTTSGLLVWTMVLLSKHPHWQARAREEVLQVFGDDDNKIPKFEGLVRLNVITMILHEVLRLYPPIVLLNRTVKKKAQLGNLTLPAGVLLSIPTILIHQDPELWGEDAKEFKPERFTDGVSKATNGQLSFFPFAWGPRICIGQNFSLVETKMALALILRRFTFELSPTYVHAPISVVNLRPQHGARIVLHKR